jgi:hypothetical protein
MKRYPEATEGEDSSPLMFLDIVTLAIIYGIFGIGLAGIVASVFYHR